MHNIKRKIAFLLAGIMVTGTLTATPFYKEVKVSAAAQEENVNLMPNGNFDTVTDNWGSYTTDGGKATVEQKDGALVCDAESVGTLNYSVQASCGYGFGLYQGGKYRLSFDINSTIARDIEYRIQMNGGDYRAYVEDKISIDSETKTVSIEFTMTENTDLAPALCFNMGIMDGIDLDAHTVVIDNVDLQLIDGSGIQQSTSKQEEDVNLIPSGNFDEVSSNWGSYTTDGGKAVIEQKDGALVCDIASVGTLNYSVQASCGSGFTLYQNGKYRLSFDINSTLARNLEYGIQMNGGDYRAYVSKQISVDSDVQKVTIEFTMLDETDRAPALFFNMGIYNDEELAEHTVTIDNVDLRLIDGSGIVYDDTEEEEQPININQIGYKTDAEKIAVFRGAEMGSTFKVINAEDESVVYEGAISEGSYNEAADEVDYQGDFSAVTTAGTYYIEVEGLGKSYEFEIGDDIFNNVFTDAFRFFYLQRCGNELDEKLAGALSHGVCHTTLARIYGTEDYIDVSGGWHDAGDYGRYVVATSKAVADLLLAYDANKDAFNDSFNIPESGNGQSDMLDEIRGQLEWLLKMQNKENGGVYHKVTCANFPGYVAADEETAELIVTPISTTATGDFAAIMGMGYEEFKDVDPEFAAICLAAGEKAYDYLAEQPSSIVTNPEGIVTGEYGDFDDSDERYWAAASLYKATGDSKYHDAFKAYVAKNVKSGYGWQAMGNYANNLYLSCENQDEDTANSIKASILKEADSRMAIAKKDGYGVSNTSGDYYWGSNMATLNNASLLVDAYRITGDKEYLNCAKEHVNYMLGKNPVGTSYVIGYGDVSPVNPHHRPSMVAGEPIKGGLVGGPNKNLEDNYAKAYLYDKAPAKCYLDHAESYSTNELDIYWNSTLVRALAEMDFVDASDEVTDIAISADVDTQVNVNAINQTYTIKADGADTIDTSKLTLRYYFDKADTTEMNLACDYAAVNFTEAPWYQHLTTSTNGEIVKTNAGYYVELSVDDAVSLTADNGTMTITTRINNADWTNFDSVTDGRLVVYYDGKLVK